MFLAENVEQDAPQEVQQPEESVRRVPPQRTWPTPDILLWSPRPQQRGTSVTRNRWEVGELQYEFSECVRSQSPKKPCVSQVLAIFVEREESLERLREDGRQTRNCDIAGGEVGVGLRPQSSS